MIILITGVPGSGKTLKAVEMILDYQKKGRQVYSDISNLNIEGVLPSPADWRDTPEGSVVVYDECQKIFPSTGKAGVADDDRIRAMETHRHTGHDLIFITQAHTFLHSHIRKLVGKHYHVFRAMGLQSATIYAWDQCAQNVNDYHEKQRADVQRWNYPKELFRYYSSATIHTHKFQIPKKLTFIIIAALVTLGVSFYFLKNSFIGEAVGITDKPIMQSQSANRAQDAPVALAQEYIDPSLDALHHSKIATVAVSGCVSGVHCRCFDTDGFIVDLEPKICRSMASGMLALPVRIGQNSSTERRGEKTSSESNRYNPLSASSQNSASNSSMNSSGYTTTAQDIKIAGSNSPPNMIGHPDQGKVW